MYKRKQEVVMLGGYIAWMDSDERNSWHDYIHNTVKYKEALIAKAELDAIIQAGNVMRVKSYYEDYLTKNEIVRQIAKKWCEENLSNDPDSLRD